MNLYYVIPNADGRLGRLYAFVNVPDNTPLPNGAVALTEAQYVEWRDNPDTRALAGGVLQVVPATLARTVSGAEFLALWTPTEIAAGIAADPRLLAGAFRAMTQNSVNLDSPDLASLLALAVAKGALTTARAAQITAGTAPAP